MTGKLLVVAILLFFFLPLVHADSTLKINEFSAHPSSGNKEWVEFYNPGNVDLATYYLDDDTDFNSDSGTSAKKSLAGYNNTSPEYPFLEFSSYFNNSGDWVVLFDQNGAIIDQFQYTQDPGTDVTIGRSPNDFGNFYNLDSSSKGASNGSPQASPTPEDNYSTPPTSIIPPKSPSPSPSPSASPSPSPKAETAFKTKVAGILTGSGLVIIGASIGFFLWYQRTIKPKEEDKD